MGAAVVAAAIARKQQELMDRFIRAGATTPTAAMPLAALDIDPSDRITRALMENGVIHDAGTGRYYFDIDAYRALNQGRKRLAVVVAVLVIIAAGILGVMATARAGPSLRSGRHGGAIPNSVTAH